MNIIDKYINALNMPESFAQNSLFRVKQLYIKYLFLFVFLLPSFSSYAFDIYIGGIYYDLSEKGAIIVKGDKDYSGNVIIPDSINLGDNRYQVIGIGEEAFSNCTELTGIEFAKTKRAGAIIRGEASFFSIGDKAFNGCTGLTSIAIPYFVTTIGKYAFNGCSGLLTVTLLYRSPLRKPRLTYSSVSICIFAPKLLPLHCKSETSHVIQEATAISA